MRVIAIIKTNRIELSVRLRRKGRKGRERERKTRRKAKERRGRTRIIRPTRSYAKRGTGRNPRYNWPEAITLRR